MTKTQSDKDIEREVYSIADDILFRLQAQSNGDAYVSIAALAVAMCCLARADGMPVARLREAIEIADRQIRALDH